MSVEKSLPDLERLLQDETVTKEDLDDLAWLIENPQYEERPVDVKTFINSPLYGGCILREWEQPVSSTPLLLSFS